MEGGCSSDSRTTMYLSVVDGIGSKVCRDKIGGDGEDIMMVSLLVDSTNGRRGDEGAKSFLFFFLCSLFFFTVFVWGFLPVKALWTNGGSFWVTTDGGARHKNENGTGCNRGCSGYSLSFITKVL